MARKKKQVEPAKQEAPVEPYGKSLAEIKAEALKPKKGVKMITS